MRVAWMLVGVLSAAAACGGSDSGPSPSPPPGPPPPPPPPNTVSVAGTQYNPSSLTVSPQTTVTWQFNDGPHDVTFEDNQGNSDRNKSSGTHTRSFSANGNYRYRCTIHSTNFTSGMTGAITVQ